MQIGVEVLLEGGWDAPMSTTQLQWFDAGSQWNQDNDPMLAKGSGRVGFNVKPNSTHRITLTFIGGEFLIGKFKRPPTLSKDHRPDAAKLKFKLVEIISC